MRKFVTHFAQNSQNYKKINSGQDSANTLFQYPLLRISDSDLRVLALLLTCKVIRQGGGLKILTTPKLSSGQVKLNSGQAFYSSLPLGRGRSQVHSFWGVVPLRKDRQKNVYVFSVLVFRSPDITVLFRAEHCSAIPFRTRTARARKKSVNPNF